LHILQYCNHILYIYSSIAINTADKSKKIRCHGYNKKKCYKPRTHDVPGDLICAGDAGRSAKQRRAEVLKRLPSTGSSGRPQTSSTKNKKIGESNFRRSLSKNDEPTHDQPKSRRSKAPTRRRERARTLSPQRTTVKESSAHTKYRNLHASLVMPKGYDTKELLDSTEPIIKHPQRKYSNPLTKSPSSENLSCNALSNTTPKKDNTKKERKRRVSKELGYCSVHPNVQLTVVRTVSKSSKGGGSFNVVKESCPICAAPSTLDLIAPDTTKVLKCKEVDITLDPVAPDTAKVLKPKCKEVDFSSSAPMVIYKPKRSTSRNDKKVDKKEGEDQDNDRRHLHNSTTRLLRRKGSDGKKSKEQTSGNAVVATEVDMKEGEDQDDRTHLQNSSARLMRRRSSDGKNAKDRTSGNTMKKVKALDYFRA